MKKSPFKTVSRQLPFWPDMTDENHKPFTGLYDSSANLGDSPNADDQIPVYVFAEINTGELVYIIQSYSIKKAVEAAKKEYGTLNDIVFNFDFKGKTVVKGKPFNLFETGYCTLQDFRDFNEAPIEGKKSKK